MSGRVRGITEIIFLGNKVATAQGACLGVFIYLILVAFRQSLLGVLDLSVLSLACPFGGILLANGVAYLRRPKLSPSIAEVLAFIQEAERSGTQNS